MADPLSIASAIVGILAAAGQVIKVLGPYVSAAKDTPMTAASVRSEVVNFRIILSAFQGLLDNLNITAGTRTGLVPIDDLIIVLTDGVLIFSELEASVSSLDATGTERPSLTLRIQWARKEKELSAIVNRLQSFKGSILLLLNILQCDSDHKACQTQGELFAKVQNLWANPALVRRLSVLEDVFDGLSVIEPPASVARLNTTSSISDDMSFYSINTIKPDRQPAQLLGPPQSSSSISPPEFETDLGRSRVYQRVGGGDIRLSSGASIVTSKAASVFSGISLADISVLSAIAVPIYPAEISNAQHYVFSEAKASNAIARKYYASRGGYANCSSRVIGRWSESTRRVVRLSEFRFEVQFASPVIFLCPPSNKKGPVKNEPIIFIDGSERSVLESGSDIQDHPSNYLSDREYAKRAVHTADNERASWLALLSALQKMERESREWQQKQHLEMNEALLRGPKGSAHAKTIDDTEILLQGVSYQYTLSVAIQKKLRSWDTMPINVKRPYATTVWCHLIELLAMLGVYWVEFNRVNNRYLAEGNGYTVTGENVSNLGIMFTFQVHSWSHFGSNRVIPVQEVKELCFGFVPTIYQSPSDSRRLISPDELRDLSVFNLATDYNVAETLVLIGCNTKTVNYFSPNSIARRTHLFPIAFEIVGMLARTLHIENSTFRMLPNPTRYRWDANNFSLPKLLRAFGSQMQSLQEEQEKEQDFPGIVGEAIQGHIRLIETRLGEGTGLRLMNALHAALDDMDEILTARRKRNGLVSRNVNGKWEPFRVPEDQVDFEPARRAIVRDVLRSHIQEVLAFLNDETDMASQTTFSDDLLSGKKSPPLFNDINTASPEIKQDRLMETYFRVIRRKVIEGVQESAGRQEQISQGGSGSQQTNPSTETVRTPDDDDEPILLHDVSGDYIGHGDIWCTLVFRMICWLMLHDFHKKDVQLPKSELCGSRLPVYIS